MKDPYDWKDVERKLRMIADRYGTRISRRGSGIPSVNAFTPDIVGIWRLPNNRPVELAYGWSDWSNCYIYGVTTRPDDNDLSHACFDLDAVEATIASISKSEDIDPITTRKRA